MKRITPFTSFGNPWLAWSELAWKTGEMMLASAQVIQHRTRRIAAAGARPNARDRREFSLMGQEKIEAALASAQAMAANMAAMNAQLRIRGFEQMMSAARLVEAGMRPIHARATANARRLSKRHR